MKCDVNLSVCLVSSQAMRETDFKISIPLAEKSPRLPIGVAVIYKVGTLFKKSLLLHFFCPFSILFNSFILMFVIISLSSLSILAFPERRFK